MPPRKKPAQPAKPTLTIGAGALVAGALYLLVWLVKTYPREACAVGVALCREHMPAAPPPVVITAPMPPGLLTNQWPASRGCPPPYQQVGNHPGCWAPIEGVRPPCGAAAEALGRCWSALIVTPARPSVEDPRRPDLKPWR